MYYYTHLEDYITRFYMQLGITDLSLLSFQEVAARLGVKVFYWSERSQALFIEGRAYIFLEENLSPEEEWQDFCHELCHVLLHSGNQFDLPPLFQKYQEHKANNFMYHACVPTFLLERMELYDFTHKEIAKIQQNFCVEHDFAKNRLIQFLNNKQNQLYRYQG
ncbi:ImmA/IrrE family metallo-endopeptidase [Metasolibacillus sp. FSL H7-0170]|uniref:ImmA/IrrE family metallo-endopeptidase n=1 Tax=unclassified Metasolibacillus TaxID=2703679 RepID=UPI00079654A1|nr:hypothetical protein A0U40_00565 [[Bacillus] sp. KCTC 13219]